MNPTVVEKLVPTVPATKPVRLFASGAVAAVEAKRLA